MKNNLRILLTSTSFQDTPGRHHDLLNAQGFAIDTLRGPLSADEILPVINKYDGIICGDDELNGQVIKSGANSKLKVISKYGIGLDKIDISAAEEYGIPVINCSGVNHVTVAEHVFALLLSYYKNIPKEVEFTKLGKWKRLIGHEIFGQTIGIAGLGRIGKEVAKRAIVFGLNILVYDLLIDEKFVSMNRIKIESSLERLFEKSDIVSLHMNLTSDNRHVVSKDLITNHTKRGLVLINTARGDLVDLDALIYGLEKRILGAYLTDVLNKEPMPKDYSLRKYENVLITPHIGSRTFESVERQGIMAVENLINELKKGIKIKPLNV
tara:strand:+ start:6171 stop:7142 length:972 start_codon:yes stop_codon:yes gene_type:complete